MIGAVIGGAISLLLAKQSSKETVKRDAAAKRERQRAEAFRSLLNAQHIYSDLVGIQSLIHESLNQANEAGMVSMPNWTKVVAPVGVFERIPIDTNDLVIFMEAKEPDVINDLREISMQHATVCTAMKLYADLRTQLKDHMVVEETKGNVHSSMLTADELKRLSPRFLEMESLLTSVTSRLPGYISKAKSVVTHIPHVTRKFLNDPNFPTVRFPTEEELFEEKTMALSKCDPTEATKTAFSYSWEWFKYHADQRMKLFQFYFLGVAILSTGYHQSLTTGRSSIATAIAVFTALLSIAFLRLDQRTRELVKIGEAYLKKVEDALEPHVGAEIGILKTADAKKSEFVGPAPNFFYSYGQVMQTIYALVIALCVGAAYYAMQGA